MIIEALLPLLGVVLGATLSPWVAHKFAKAKERLAFKQDAYLGLIRAVSRIVDTGKSSEAEAELREAIYKIVIHGSKDVVDELMTFMTENDLADSAGQSKFVAVIVAMRRDIGTREFEAKSGPLSNLVFGK